MKRIMAGIVAVLMVAGLMATATENTDMDRILKLKSGKCEFKLLDSKGVTPLRFSEITFASPETGDVVVQATTDKKGNSVVALETGRYIIGVNGINLSIMDVTETSEITECRIVVPEEPMMVGAGGDEDNDDTNAVVVVPPETSAAAAAGSGGAGISSMTYVIVGGAAVLAGGGAAIGENNDWFKSYSKSSKSSKKDDGGAAGGDEGSDPDPTSP
ncbi:hypothetical protein H8D64_01655 [PVC group bacterium]|nr:hypothetical protein [PVC group bacterium]